MTRGSITKRGKGWQIKYDLPRDHGIRRQRYATVTGTYKDAQRELTRLLNSVDGGTHVDPTSMTVAEYLRSWLDGAAKVSPKTLERYGELAAQQVIPHLGALKLQKLRPEHVEQWHGTLLKAGLAPRTVGHAHRLLVRVLGYAVENGTLARNVAVIRKPPKVEEQELEILTANQIAEVRTKLAGHTLLPIVELALATGMRRGELLGLQWGDLDLDKATLRVERSVEETRAGLRLKPPKTRRGRRSVTLGEGAVSMLRAHRAKQLELRLALGLGKITDSTLVLNTVEGELLRPRNITKAWSRAVPDKTFHSLRHARASMLINAGVDIITVSRRLGHSAAAITLDVYGHLIEGADAAWLAVDPARQKLPGPEVVMSSIRERFPCKNAK
jgi:integrase